MFLIETNKDLTHLNSLGFKSLADRYCCIQQEADLIQAITYSQDNNISYQVLSGGSNLLIAEYVKGLTLHMQIKGREVISQTDEELILRVAAGENWHQLVTYCVDQNWQGIETLALIPGLVGAAPVQNIGAYGSEIKDVLVTVRAFDVALLDFIELDLVQCEFSYRDSFFKRNPGRYIITSIDIKLSKQYTKKKNYAALEQYFSDNNVSAIKLQDIYSAICAVRESKLPNPQQVPNAGSFFKNPCISQTDFDRLKINFPKIVGYQMPQQEVKVAAGWLIETCGWKGHQSQGVGVYHKQALVLIHTGGASIQQLLVLAEDIKKSVFDKFSIRLEVEPQHFP